jgi:hypothetical protein
VSNTPSRGAQTPNVLLHVGWPRTGTTTLQACLTTLPQNVARPWADAPDPRAEHLMLSLQRDERWDQAALLGYLADCIRSSGSRDLILSDEAIVGSFASDRLGHLGALVVGERLHRALPDAQVWFSLRQPRSLLRSLYRHAVSKGYDKRYETFLTEAANELDRSGPWRLDLRHIVDAYAKCFGADRIIVTTLDDLMSSPSTFWPTMADRTRITALASLGDRPLPHENAARIRRPRIDAWLNRWAFAPSWEPDRRRPQRTARNRRLARLPLPSAAWPTDEDIVIEDQIADHLSHEIEGLLADYGP